MINSSDLAILVPWLLNHGYLIFLIGAIIEGPFTTIAGGVVAALGYFNIYIILVLALLGDIIGDIFYFSIGYMSHNLIRSPFFRYLGLNELLIKKIQKLVHARILQALLLVKISPLIGPIGLIVIGASRPPFKSFIKPALIISVPKSFFFVLLGYYSGSAYLQLNKIVAQGQYIAMGIIVVMSLIYYAYIKITGKIAKGIEDQALKE
jgi:membrane protein DedA with SNARE-associated domain